MATFVFSPAFGGYRPAIADCHYYHNQLTGISRTNLPSGFFITCVPESREKPGGDHYAIKSSVLIDFIDINETAFAVPSSRVPEGHTKPRAFSSLRELLRVYGKATVCIQLQFEERKILRRARISSGCWVRYEPQAASS